MRPGAQTPEELETLFEDAFVTRDRQAVAQLFEDGAVLRAGGAEARGGEQIRDLVGELWERNVTYLADPLRVLQARDSALVLARGGINVVRRGRDGVWRYTIALLNINRTNSKEEQ
jgi:hypothetical protein